MDKKMDLGAFDVYKYLKKNFSNDANAPFIIADQEMYKKASIRFPVRNFSFGVGIVYAEGSWFHVSNQEYKMQGNALITIGPGIVSKWKDNYLPSDTILFDEELLKDFLKHTVLSSLTFFLPGGNHVLRLSEENAEKVKLLFQTIRKFKTDTAMVAGITYALLMLVIKIHESEGQNKKGFLSYREALVGNFRSLVTKHFLKHKDVRFYANSLHITPKYLSEVLMDETGKSAKTIIEDTIFLEAKSLLRQTQMNIQEICYHLGYADTSYFTKAFKKKQGITPRSIESKGISKNSIISFSILEKAGVEVV